MSEELKPRIFVLDRGHVIVGYSVDPMGCALWIEVFNSRIIRRWGTTDKGLSHLANGPTSETILDTIAKRKAVPVRAIISVEDVEESAWKRHLQS